MDLTNRDRIYSSLLYQLINSVCLVNDKFKLDEYTDYLRDIFGYSSTAHREIIDIVRALDKPKRICDLTVIEAIDLHFDVIPAETPPRLFVTAEFDDAVDDEIQHTKISDKMVWNDTMSLLLDEAKMNDSLVIRIWNNYYRKEEAIIGQRFLEGIFFKQVTTTSPMEDIVKAGKRGSYIIGKATIPLKAINPSTIFTWQVIDKKDPRIRKSLIKLKVNYTLQENEHFFPDSTVEYSVLLETLLRYELKESQVSGYWWDGKFTKLGESLLIHYIKSKHLSKHITKLTQWQVACKIQGTHPLAFSLFHDIVNSIYEFIRDNCFTDEQLTLFWSSCVKLLENSEAAIKNFDFDNEKRITNLLRTMHKISSIVSMCKVGLLGSSLLSKEPVLEIDRRARNSIEKIIEEATRENVRIWFDKNLNQEVVGRDEEDGLATKSNMNKFEIEKLCQLLDKIQERLCLINDDYAVPYKKHMNINLPDIYFSELEKLYVEHALSTLKCITWCIDYDIDARRSNYDQQKVFLDQFKVFYMKLKGFNESIVKTLPPSKNVDKFSDYHKWFDEISTVWFKILGIETRKGIVKAVKLDEKLNLEGSKHTSSAGDTFDLLYVLLVQFNQIVSVEHDKAFVIASEIVSEICDSCSTYFDEVSEPLNSYWNNKTEETTLDKTLLESFADVINNVEYLTMKVSEIIEGIFIHILDSNDAMIVNKKYPGLEDCQNNLNKNVTTLMKQFVKNKIAVSIQKLLKDAVVIACKDSNAFEPVMQFLNDIMPQLDSLLSTDTFNKLSELIWNEILIQFRMSLEKLILTQQDVQGFASFKRCFDRVKESFDGFVTLEENCEDLKFLVKELQKRGCSALELIHSYYVTLTEEQEKATETFGMLTFSGTFTDDCIDLHILNGRNLVPKTGVDGETEPDTYVEVEFYFADPSKYNLKNMKTKTINKNQFPLYDELLKVPLTQSEQSLDDTIIVFTLWDPDYYGMVQNYLGECCVTLKELKDTDKQIIKKIWKPHEKSNECLLNLKTRTDKQARELYKNFKLKCTQNPKSKKKTSMALPNLRW